MDIEENIKQLESEMDDLIMERYELYQKVQNFNVSANITKSIISGLSKKKREIVTTQNKINKLKREAGYNECDIKAQVKSNLMKPNDARI